MVEICYLRRLADELGLKQPEGTILWKDNKACIILAEGETSGGGRSKDIDIKFRYIAENVKAGHVREEPGGIPKDIRLTSQLADFCTRCMRCVCLLFL